MINRPGPRTVDMRVGAYCDNLALLVRNLEVTGSDGAPLLVDESLKNVVSLILSVKAAGAKVILVGNGGSAAIAGHTQNDLSKAVGVRAIAFHDPPLLTALSNDLGYETAFERGVELWANRGDLTIAISSSGQSQNILRAVKASKARACKVVTLTGFDPRNPLRMMGHFNIHVASREYGFVESAHSVIMHFLTDWAVELASRGGER